MDKANLHNHDDTKFKFIVLKYLLPAAGQLLQNVDAEKMDRRVQREMPSMKIMEEAMKKKVESSIGSPDGLSSSILDSQELAGHMENA